MISVTFLLGATVTVTAVAAIEALVLIGLARRLLWYGQQLVNMGADLARLIPDSGAPRTDGAGTQPVDPDLRYPRLRILADMRQALADRREQRAADQAEADELDRLAAAGLPPAGYNPDVVAGNLAELEREMADPGRRIVATDPDLVDTGEILAVDPDPRTSPAPRVDIAYGARLPARLFGEAPQLWSYALNPGYQPERLDDGTELPSWGSSGRRAVRRPSPRPRPPIVDDVDASLARWGLRAGGDS